MIKGKYLIAYLVILPDDNADTFATHLLISYYSFLFLILSLIVMNNSYIFPKGLHLKHERSSSSKVVLLTKSEYGSAVSFLKPLNSMSDE